MVYERNPHTVDELKEYISEAFIEIDADQDLCRAMCHNDLLQSYLVITVNVHLFNTLLTFF
jgi:hypothetical protein